MDLRLIIFIVFIVFKVIQAVAKKANEGAVAQQRMAQVGDPDRNRRDRKQRVQSEIDSFLSEVRGGSPSTSAPVSTNAAALRKREQQKQQAISKRRQQEERRRRREAAASQQQQQPKKRQGISEHVDQYISQHVAEHIDDDVTEYVEATIVDNVNDNPGKRALEMPTMASSSSRGSSTKAAEAVAAMLRDPKGVRNAILVNEILSRPRALR